jgi:hypothetical protein
MRATWINPAVHQSCRVDGGEHAVRRISIAPVIVIERDSLVTEQTRIVNQVKASLIRFGIHFSAETAQGRGATQTSSYGGRIGFAGKHARGAVSSPSTSPHGQGANRSNSARIIVGSSSMRTSPALTP